METKQCKQCNIVKPFDDFAKHKHYKDGRLNKCHECIKETLKTKKGFNIEKYVQESKAQFEFSLE